MSSQMKAIFRCLKNSLLRRINLGRCTKNYCF